MSGSMGQLDRFTEGMRAYRLGDYVTAVDILGCLAERKDLPGKLARYYCAMGHRALGVVSAQAGRFAEAARRFQAAIGLIGSRADLIEYLLVAYARTGQHERCADQAEVLSGLRPDDVSARVRQAQAQWRSGRRPLAIMTLTGALRELGDKAPLHLNLGLFYAAGDDLDQAATHLARAVDCDCTWAKTHRYLGLVESARGDFYRAAESLQRAYALAPRDLVLAYQLCLAADAAARANCPITLSLPEFNSPSAVPEGPAGPADGPMRQMAEYVAAEPDFVGTFLALPPTDSDKELFGTLSSILDAALACHEDYADLHYYAGLTSDRLGQFDKARAQAMRAIRINPRYAKALIHLADIDARRGATGEAADSLRRAVDSGADFPEVHTRLGDLMKEDGMKDQARRHYLRALELNGNYRLASDGMASLAA